MSNKIAELTSKRNKLIADSQVLVNAGKANSAEYRAMSAELDVIQSDIDALSLIESKLPKSPAPVAAPAAIRSEPKKERKVKLNTAFRSMLLHGYHSSLEQRDITIASDGAAVIPQEYSKAITQAQRWYGPLATLVKRIDSDSGRNYKQTISDDTATTMTYIAESGATSSIEADPTLSSVIPGTDSLITVVKYSKQELEDADDLETFIQGIAGLRVARAVEYALTLGKDNGSTTQLPNSPTGGLLANVSAGVTQTSGELSAGPTYGQLSALAGSVDHAYYAAPSSGFMASPSVFNFLVAQTDTTGRPLYKFSSETGLLQIAGKPLYVNNAMPNYNAASSPAVLFGSFQHAYSYLNGSGASGMRIRVLKERFADVFEGAAIIYTRLGAATLVSGAVKALVTAAS
jgi:HK97 family phage major capsid protein